MATLLSSTVPRVRAAQQAVTRALASVVARTRHVLGGPRRAWRRLQDRRHAAAIRLSEGLTTSRTLAFLSLVSAVLGCVFMPAALAAPPLALGALATSPSTEVDPLPRPMAGGALVLGGLVSAWLGGLLWLLWGALAA